MSNKVKLTVGAPSLIRQGEPYEKVEWGCYQFPYLRRTASGGIYATWAMSADSADEYTGATGEAVSDDGAVTWRDLNGSDRIVSDLRLKNGRYLKNFAPVDAYKVDWLGKYTPTASHGDRSYYLARDIKEADLTVTGMEYDPVTGKDLTFPVKVEWENMPLVVIENNKVVPLAAFMSLCGAGGIISHNGSLYFCMYSQGPDAVSGAATNKMYYNIYILKSDDDARTWYYYSQIVTAPEYFTACPEMEGFCEPQMRRMPDGSFVMLMRTGSYLPSYISHCYDDCRTWSKPEPFDTTGVFPQLLTLDCGITLATYGRPKLFVRATSDPSGKTWDEPRRIELSDDTKERASCCYTALLPLDAHTALLAYSDFYYPNAEGIPVKSMMTRKITVGI